MSRPGRPPRSRTSSSSPRNAETTHAAMSASRGGFMIALAVIVGLLIYATIDGGGSSGTPATAGPTPSTNADGTPVTTAPGTTSTTNGTTSTTADTKGARPNAEVIVQVLNGSGITGAATQRSNDLKAKGYQLLAAGNAPAQRQGHAVQCKDGYEKEAQVLVNELEPIGVTATIETPPDPLPATFDGAANCYVILGQ